jgi:8-oxo-dGTP pyrophosphatase MutT (NUDIX family)
VEHLLPPEAAKMNDFKQASLELFAQQATTPYPGYPSFEERLRLKTARLSPCLPAGPWEMAGDALPTPAEVANFQALGYNTDELGRPLHPWLNEMLTNPKIGIVTGKGAYWYWGPNLTADPIVMRYDQPEPMVLLISRRDTGQWALPGGFIDAGETALQAAIREAGEEALIDLDQLPTTGQLVYQGPLNDTRATAHAWPETTAYLFALPPEVTTNLPLGPYKAGDDADTAYWQPVNRVGELLFGSHQLLVAGAVDLAAGLALES